MMCAMATRIDQAQTIKEYLARQFPSSHERTRRQMVEFGRVSVNGQIVKSLKQPLRPGDRISIGAKKVVALPRGIERVYEDDHIFVVTKASGLLTITTPGEKRPTVHALLNDYVRAAGTGERVWCVHRLDRDASGLLVLAKTESAWRWLKDDFRARRVKKAYAVLAEGRVETAPGAAHGGYQTIQSFLRENARNRMESVEDFATAEDDDAGGAKLAVTRYRVEQTGPDCTLLRVETDTGRKHQIRVHMAEIGHPVAGDREYGSLEARGEGRIGRLGLHACELVFNHPRTGQPMRFESPAPASFVKALRDTPGTVATIREQPIRQSSRGVQQRSTCGRTPAGAHTHDGRYARRAVRKRRSRR